MNGDRVSFDRLAALSGAVFSGVLALYVGLRSGNPLYVLTALLAFAACCLWVARGRAMRIPVDWSGSPRATLAFVSLFFISFAASIWSVYLRSNPYERPTAFFVLTAFMALTIGSQIFLHPAHDARFTAAIILQTILLGLSLNWTQVLIFPSVTGIDPAFYRLFTLRMLGSGHIPPGNLYSSFPTTQLATGAVMLATGARYEVATMFSITLVQIVLGVLITYLLGRNLTGSGPIGLLGSLMLVTANRFVEFGWWATPTTFASAFVLVILYLLVKRRAGHLFAVTSLILLLSVFLVFTHTVTTVALAVAMIVSWSVSLLRKPLSLVVTNSSPARLGTALILCVFMFAWWTFAALNALKSFGQVIQSGFTIDAFYKGPLYVGYLSSVSILERTVDNAGFVLMFAFSLIGSLHFLARKGLNTLAFATSGLAFLLLGFISPVFGREILNVRWWYYAQVLLAMPAAVGVLLVVSLAKKKRLKQIIAVLVVFCLSLLMITSSASNTDNFSLSPDLGTRVAFTESEFAAAAFFSSHWAGKFSSDFEYATNPSSSVFINYYDVDSRRVQSLDSALLDGNFSSLRSAILIRAATVGKPFALSGGLYRLDYDPNSFLSSAGFDRVYDSGSVTGYEYPP